MTEPRRGPAGGAAISVLLVEDNPGDARLIREELREVERSDGGATAFELVCADHLAAALDRLAAHAVDVVLLDLSLPDGYGLDTLASVCEAAPSTPVLVLTGLDDQELAARAVREGAQDYLVKGRVDSGLLGRTIRYAIERGRLLASERAARAESESARARTEEANLELVRLAAEAQAANRTKSAFLAMMSHELRTPLNAILGYTQLLEMGLHGPVNEAQRESLQRIQKNQARLLSLVTQILDYAKLEAGQLRLDVQEFPASELLGGIDDVIMPQVRAKGLCFECCWGCDGRPVLADYQRAQQILLNLLSNAIKFTDPGGTIGVSCESTGGSIAVHVWDTGRGIPADKIETVFEPFVQVDQDFTRTVEGAGLGLTISRDLAKAMGGDLAVESTPGRGSTFTLSLPTAGQADAAADRAPGIPAGAARAEEAPAAHALGSAGRR